MSSDLQIRVLEAVGPRVMDEILICLRDGKRDEAMKQVEDHGFSAEEAEKFIRFLLQRVALRKTEHYQRITEFMQKAGQATPETPEEPSEEVRILRARLMLEEVLETICDGLGVAVTPNQGGRLNNEKGFSYKISRPYNMVETADGCADVSVVTIGTLIACGISDVALLEEVDSNNLAKFGPGGYRDEGGKWQKPADHRPPKIAEILAQQKGLG